MTNPIINEDDDDDDDDDGTHAPRATCSACIRPNSISFNKSFETNYIRIY